MNTVYLAAYPACDICGADARYDMPTRDGRWANLCQRHKASHGNLSGWGNVFVLGERPPVTREAVLAALEAGDMEALFDLAGDGDPTALIDLL